MPVLCPFSRGALSDARTKGNARQLAAAGGRSHHELKLGLRFVLEGRERPSTWLVVNVETGAVLAVATALEGAVAVAAGADFDPEEWLRDVLARDTDRDAVARVTLPAAPPPASWRYLTRG